MTDPDNHNQSLLCLMMKAERELGAFIKVVRDSYGARNARIAAADWLDEFELLKAVSTLTTRELRQITIAAAARLASRLELPAQPDGLKAFGGRQSATAKQPQTREISERDWVPTEK